MFRSAGKPIDYLPSPEDVKRFLGKVVVDGSCWRWVGGKQKNYEYGVFKLGGACHRAHRIAFQIFVGPLELGEDVNHRNSCRHQWCVNPRHLEAMTRSENVADGNRHRKPVPVLFMGGPLDGDEKHFYPGRFPETFEIKRYGQIDTYRFDEDLREYVYDGVRRTRRRG